MRTKISYKLNFEKAIEALVWLAQNKPGIDIYHIAKVLYWAEKTHINRYGRPVVGDTYIKMDYGQAPSNILDLLKNKMRRDTLINEQHIDSINKSLRIASEENWSIWAIRLPNMDYFSATDIECLAESLRKYGDMSFDELKETSHNEKTFIESMQDNRLIDYLLFIDDDNPNKEEIMEDMIIGSRHLQL